MTTEIMDPDQEWKMNPEMQAVAESYLITTDVRLTAHELGIPKEKVTYYLNRPECKRFIDTIYLEQGYLNRHRLQDLLSDIIEKKIQEMEESELGTSKDIVDLIALVHKMRMDELKLQVDSNKPAKQPTNQTNVQINSGFGGDNYNSLLEKLIKV